MVGSNWDGKRLENKDDSNLMMKKRSPRDSYCNFIVAICSELDKIFISLCSSISMLNKSLILAFN